MKYITTSYFESLRPDAFDRVSVDIVPLVIDEAQAQVDLYIGRYLPLSEVPPSLKAIMVDIVEYRLAGDEVSELIQNRYNGALDALARIEKAGFPEFYNDSPSAAKGYSFGNDYNAKIDRSGW